MAEEAKELGLFLSIEMSLGCGVQQQMPGGHNYLDNWQGQRGSPGALTSQELLVEFHLSRAMVPNLFSTSDWLHGKQFFHRPGVGGMVLG